MALVEKGASGGSVAWIAVEDPVAPWPPLPGKDVSAGPFYLVWEHPERSKVGTELWPYQTVAITGVESPAHRWPQMAVAATLPADDPARHGQAVFTTQCMPCHRMKGAGAADVGPDLGQPMNPTQYLTPRWPARADPQPEGGAHLAAAADAGVRRQGAVRRRPRRRHRLSRAHGDRRALISRAASSWPARTSPWRTRCRGRLRWPYCRRGARRSGHRRGHRTRRSGRRAACPTRSTARG